MYDCFSRVYRTVSVVRLFLLTFLYRVAVDLFTCFQQGRVFPENGRRVRGRRVVIAAANTSSIIHAGTQPIRPFGAVHVKDDQVRIFKGGKRQGQILSIRNNNNNNGVAEHSVRKGWLLETTRSSATRCQSIVGTYIKIIGIITKGIIQVNGDNFQAEKSIRDQKDDTTMGHIAAGIPEHDKGNGKDIEK